MEERRVAGGISAVLAMVELDGHQPNSATMGAVSVAAELWARLYSVPSESPFTIGEPGVLCSSCE
jgi:hypothetical protein